MSWSFTGDGRQDDFEMHMVKTREKYLKIMKITAKWDEENKISTINISGSVPKISEQYSEAILKLLPEKGSFMKSVCIKKHINSKYGLADSNYQNAYKFLVNNGIIKKTNTGIERL